MALYGLAQRTSSAATNAAYQEIRSTSSNKPRLIEYGLSQTAAQTVTYGIGRPGSIGISPTSPQLFVDEGDGNAPAAQTSACVAWGTGPTAPTIFNRRFTGSMSGCSGVIFSFPRGFSIPPSGSIVLWGIAGNLQSVFCDVYAVIDE